MYKYVTLTIFKCTVPWLTLHSKCWGTVTSLSPFLFVLFLAALVFELGAYTLNHSAGNICAAFSR
jgi:hypothetical protein